MKKQLFAATVFTAMVSGTVAHAADDVKAEVKKDEREKCYGVAKAGKNDCASKDGSSCAGQSKKDADAGHWVYVPKGLCDKLAGGMKG